MKITEVNTYTVRPRWGFVEIVTDEGLTGWGEPVLEGHCATVLACVQEMKPYLIGKDPMRIEDFSAVLYRAGFYRGGGVLMSAISGIDQALWDIKGKFFGAPVYQLMGGACRDNMKVYSWIGGDRPSDVGAAALEKCGQERSGLCSQSGGFQVCGRPGRPAGEARPGCGGQQGAGSGREQAPPRMEEPRLASRRRQRSRVVS